MVEKATNSKKATAVGRAIKKQGYKKQRGSCMLESY